MAISSAANRGLAFEELVEAANDLYRQEGRAIIHKIPTPWKVIGYDPRRQGARRVFPERKSTVDWGGILIGGRSIQFETKESDKPLRFPIDADKIPPHQIEHLLAVEELGGEAFLLLWSVQIDTCWLVRPRAILKARSEVVGRRGADVAYRASLTWQDLNGLGNPVPWRCGIPDYLAALVRTPD